MLHYHANDLVEPRFQSNIKRIQHLKECETAVRRVSVLDDPCDKEGLQVMGTFGEEGQAGQMSGFEAKERGSNG